MVRGSTGVPQYFCLHYMRLFSYNLITGDAYWIKDKRQNAQALLKQSVAPVIAPKCQEANCVVYCLNPCCFLCRWTGGWFDLWASIQKNKSLDLKSGSLMLRPEPTYPPSTSGAFNFYLGFLRGRSAFSPKFKSRWYLYISKVIFGIINTAKLTQVVIHSGVLHSLTAGPCTESQHHPTPHGLVSLKNPLADLANICLFLFLNIVIVLEDLTLHHSMLEVPERHQISGERIGNIHIPKKNSHFDICHPTGGLWVCSSPDHQGPSVSTSQDSSISLCYLISSQHTFNLGVLFSRHRSCRARLRPLFHALPFIFNYTTVAC